MTYFDTQKKRHMEAAVEILVRGMLWKTGYRFFAMQKAVELNIRGNVTYVTGNSVKIVAEGDESKLAEFIEWCKTSTLTYRIDYFGIAKTDVFGYTDFSIISRKDSRD